MYVGFVAAVILAIKTNKYGTSILIYFNYMYSNIVWLNFSYNIILCYADQIFSIVSSPSSYHKQC